MFRTLTHVITRDGKIHPAAEQRSELSPRRGFASPGYEPSKVIEPRKGRQEARTISTTFILCRRCAALNSQLTITQGSQSFALGLTLSAASQLLSNDSDNLFVIAGTGLKPGVNENINKSS